MSPVTSALAGAAVRSSHRCPLRTGQCPSNGRERPCFLPSETGRFPVGRTISSRTGPWYGPARCPPRPLPRDGAVTRLASSDTTNCKPHSSRRQPARQPRRHRTRLRQQSLPSAIQGAMGGRGGGAFWVDRCHAPRTPVCGGGASAPPIASRSLNCRASLTTTNASGVLALSPRKT